MRLGAWAVVLALATACGGPARSPQRVPAAQKPSSSGVWHEVQRGQTLWRLARAYGTSVESLQQANRLGDSTEIAVGRLLFVPGALELLDVAPAPSLVGGDTPAGVRFDEETRVATVGIWNWPLVAGRVLSHFGAPRGSRSHRGLDLGAAHGTPVVAVRDGVVAYAAAGMRGYGKTVIVDHGDGWQTLYAHNSELLVRTGDRVAAGEAIARVGRTGNATGNHLHFEMRNNGRPVDPIVHLPRRAER